MATTVGWRYRSSPHAVSFTPVSSSRRGAGIEQPADLKGKKVAVPEYQQTAALWTRAALQHEFGVTAQDMEWYMERSEARSHGGATGFQPPADVKFNRIPADKSIASMLLAGEVDASLLYIADANLVDRSKVDLSGNTAVAPLFADAVVEGARYYANTGFFPINHCVVVQRKVYEQYPWAVLNLFYRVQQSQRPGGTAGRGRGRRLLRSGLATSGPAQGALP